MLQIYSMPLGRCDTWVSCRSTKFTEGTRIIWIADENGTRRTGLDMNKCLYKILDSNFVRLNWKVMGRLILPLLSQENYGVGKGKHSRRSAEVMYRCGYKGKHPWIPSYTGNTTA
jgi:hypothetical protein